MARLIMNPGTPQAWEITLKPGENFIGRGFANDFKIDDATVSSSHCQIVMSGDSVTLRDLGSTNGTFVDRAPVREAVLQPGQTIHLGGVELLFEDGSPTAGPASAPTAQPAIAPVFKPPVATTAATSPPLAPPIPKLAMAALPVAAGPVAVAAAAIRSLPCAPAAEVAASPVAVGQAGCRYHPKSPGRWLCSECHKYFCDLCVATRRVGETMHHYCRTCGAECSPVEVKAVVPERKSFFQLLPGAFGYPFRKEGILVFIVAGVFIAGMDFLSRFLSFANEGGGAFMLNYYVGWVLLFKAVFYGYLFAYMQNLIQSTVNGDETVPEMPAITEFVQDIIIPFFQLAVIVAVCFGPAIVVLTAGAVGENAGLAAAGAIALFALGCIYFPMTFLAVAMYDTVAAVNPLLVIPSILKVPLEYLIVCLLLGVLVVVRFFLAVLLHLLIPVPVVPVLISSFVGLYFLTVDMRILGLLYLANKEKLGWFNR